MMWTKQFEDGEYEKCISWVLAALNLNPRDTVNFSQQQSIILKAEGDGANHQRSTEHLHVKNPKNSQHQGTQAPSTDHPYTK